MPLRKTILLLSCMFAMLSCSVKKFVPEGEYLLDNAVIVSNTNPENARKGKSYIKQRPNSKWFSIAKVPMYIYSLSNPNSDAWHNRALRRLGEAPVIYDSLATERTRDDLEKMLRNDGYLHADVNVGYDTCVEKRRLTALYYLHEKNRYYVSEFSLVSEDPVIGGIIAADSLSSQLKPGMPFSVDNLEMERRRLTEKIRNMGYYRFLKDNITYTADTVHHSNKVKLTMNVSLYVPHNGAEPVPHRLYRIGKINFVSGVGLRYDRDVLALCDSVEYEGHVVYYREDPMLRPKVLLENLYLESGELFSQTDVDRTRNSFSQLNALRYTAIMLEENPSTGLLDCYIMYEANKRCSVDVELEGTNTSGDPGVAGYITFTDRNMFKGSEALSLRLLFALEKVSKLEGYKKDFFEEYGAELSLRFKGGMMSKFVADEKDKLLSQTTFAIKYNAQNRPEFDRRIMSASWNYTWSLNPGSTHKLDIIDLNYLYVPSISDNFRTQYLDSISDKNSILKYNYENLLITKLGYSYTYNSSHSKANRFKRVTYSLRAAAECSGNLLFFGNLALGAKKNSSGQYTVADIAFAQYVKGDFDFTLRAKFDNRNSLVAHMALGLAVPYGNSSTLPFEKRYFAGGANGVRGWTVRTLGPGRYKGNGNVTDYIGHTGDIKMDVSVEYRTHLFWKLHSAVFVDAGNVWTIRDYKEQPGGAFNSKFYEDIAFSYGLGVRLELDMFVFRIDCAMKAVNPAFSGKERFPVMNPDFGRDFAFHFAIGYPF